MSTKQVDGSALRQPIPPAVFIVIIVAVLAVTIVFGYNYIVGPSRTGTQAMKYKFGGGGVGNAAIRSKLGMQPAGSEPSAPQ